MRTARLLTVSQHALFGWVPARGVYLPRGCTCPRGYLPGGYLPRYSPPVIRMTDRCKNITLPQTSFTGGRNTVPCSGCLGSRGVSAEEVSAFGGVHHPLDRILDRHLWKHYLSATSFADGNNGESGIFHQWKALRLWEENCLLEDLLNTTYVTTVTIAKGYPATDYSLNSKAYLQRWNVRGRIGYRVLDGRFEYRLLVIRIEYRLLDGRFEYLSLVVSTLDWYAGGLPFEFGILPLLKHACLKRWLVTMLAIKEVGRCHTRGESHRTHIIYSKWRQRHINIIMTSRYDVALV